MIERQTIRVCPVRATSFGAEIVENRVFPPAVRLRDGKQCSTAAGLILATCTGTASRRRSVNSAFLVYQQVAGRLVAIDATLKTVDHFLMPAALGLQELVHFAPA